jgi:hypothetical protein
MLQPVLIALAALAGVAAGAHLAGERRWSARTRELRSRLEAARGPVEPPRVDFGELDGLPAPVWRWFRSVLRDGQPRIAGVRVAHRGRFRLRDAPERWVPFRSEQRVVTVRPGFLWDARMSLARVLPLRVHDAYIAREGVLEVRPLGLVPLVGLRGGGDLAKGELMRYLAEAAWYPTAVLPSQGVFWEPVDNRSARATLRDGPVRVDLLFRFSHDGLIEGVRAESRARLVGGRSLPTPWEGRFWDYAERGGMRVPLCAEIAWVLPEGPQPYWRGRIERIDYDFAPLAG